VIAAAIARLATHRVHRDLVVKALRKQARDFEELAALSAWNAEAATHAALVDGPPAPDSARRECWEDRLRLSERSAALGELASGIRCAIAAVTRGGQ